VVLQSAERHAVERFNREMDWSQLKTVEELWQYYKTDLPHRAMNTHSRLGRLREKILRDGDFRTRTAAYLKQFCLMHVDDETFGRLQKWIYFNFDFVLCANDPIASDGLMTNMPKAMNVNMKYLAYKLFYALDLKGQQPITNLYEVDRPLFAEGDGRRFLSHIGDLRNQVLAERPGWMEKMHENFNRLAKLLKQDGITLHVMISPNKLTVYQPYLTDKSVPRSIFFDRMRSFTDREYEFVDTEKVITDLIARGEKDVYFAGDSHWSDKPLDGIVRSMHLGSATVARSKPLSPIGNR
jgi:hypothetical protein